MNGGVEYSEFDLETGEILWFGEIQQSVFARKVNVIEGQYDDSLYYVIDYQPVLRPILAFDQSPFSKNKWVITANGTDELVATGLPSPFIVDIDGDEYEITDGSFEFSPDVPGTYIITPKTFPYKDKSVEVVAL